jgi:hypothetical protein
MRDSAGVVDVEKVPWQDEYDEFSKVPLFFLCVHSQPANRIEALWLEWESYHNM